MLREQAATCLKYYGIPLLLAGSFSETYKRNAFNNGYLAIEIPELISFLRQHSTNNNNSTSENATTASTAQTIRTGLRARLDFKSSTLHVSSGRGGRGGGVEKKFAFPVVGTVAQELQVCGGLEEWVKKKLSSSS